MTTQFTFSARFLIAMETILVMLLAVAAVIYGQVLIQRYYFSLSSIVVPETIVSTGEELAGTAPVIYSAAEKQQILSALTASSTEEVSQSERTEILVSLETKSEITLTTEEKQQILEALSATN